MMDVQNECKMTELGKIPVEWEIKELSSVTKIVMGQSPDSSSYNNSGEGLPFYQGKSEFGWKHPVAVKWCSKPTKIAEKNDILLSVRAPVGEVNMCEETSCIGRGLGAIKYIKNKTNNWFLYYFLIHSNSRFNNISQGSTFTAITGEELKHFNVVLPPLKEQQKIAEILLTVDEQIEQTNQLIEKTKKLKNGLIQQLLTKGLGHTEFKQSELGEIPDNWRIEKLEKITNILDGKRRPIKKNDRIAGNIPYYGATGIIDWVNNYIFDESLILVGEDGENINSRVLPMAFKVSGKTWINNHAHVLKPIENVNIDYLTYFLESVNYSIYITGTAQPKLNQEQLRKILILIPSFQEQQKIAEILLSVDEDIEGYELEKTKYEELKKGLMQQLLTGAIRVKVDE